MKQIPAMKLIVGLGNPERQYQDTRHNIGFMVVDRLACELHSSYSLNSHTAEWTHDSKSNAFVAKVGDVVLVKPQTGMNLSGLAVKKLSEFYKIAAGDIWLIHDDLDLPLGKIRIRAGGSSAGHNGVASVIKELGSDAMMRFRLGIGRGKESKGRNEDKTLHQRSVIAFVLSHFRMSEAGKFKYLIHHGVDAVKFTLDEGITKAMNRFN